MKIPRPAGNFDRALEYSRRARLGMVRNLEDRGPSPRELARVRGGAWRLYEWARDRAHVDARGRGR